MESSVTSGGESPASPQLQPELVAMAADWPTLEAALQAGADAVQLRLNVLGGHASGGLPHEELQRAVETAHQRGVRVYLDLRVDLHQRQLGQAARVLELARQKGVDAVVVRDPAFLLLAEAFPELPIHLSVAGGSTSSADVAAAADLGVFRAELCGGLSRAEIKAAAAQPEVAIALPAAAAAAVALRPPVANWMTGRIDPRHEADEGVPPDRSPRVVDMALNASTEKRRPAAARPDVAVMAGLAGMGAAGVKALLLDERVAATTSAETLTQCRRNIAGEVQTDSESEQSDSEQINSEPGRVGPEDRGDTPRLEHPELTGDSTDHPHDPAELDDEEAEDAATEPEAPMYDFTIDVTPTGIQCRCECQDRRQEWRLPKTVVRRAHKAVAIGQFMESLESQLIQGYQLGLGSTNDPDYLLVPRAVAGLIDRIAAIIRQARRSPDRLVRVELSEAAEDLLAPEEPSSVNKRHLGDRPDRVRLDYRGVQDFLRQIQPESVVLEGLTANRLEKVLAVVGSVTPLVALPPVFFEEDVAGLERLLKACREARVVVEVNSWGGWRLARRAGLKMEGGPGLAVFNSAAARLLARRGLRCVTLAPTADRRQLEETSAASPVPCCIAVFGRPPLLLVRGEAADEQLAGRPLADRRGVQMVARREGRLTAFRPVEPLDLRAVPNERIRVQHLVVDLVGADDPVTDWYGAPLEGERTFRFNYDRKSEQPR